jgi:hypothetical protein
MKNVDIKVSGNKAVITVDLTARLGKSASGKSETVASTEGNVSSPGHEDIKFGLNVYAPVTAPKA